MNITNRIVAWLIKVMAKLANQTPADWLLDRALTAELSQDAFAKLIEITH